MKGAVAGTGGSEFEEGILRRQTCATGLFESTQKTVMLLKSTFKLEPHHMSIPHNFSFLPNVKQAVM